MSGKSKLLSEKYCRTFKQQQSEEKNWVIALAMIVLAVLPGSCRQDLFNKDAEPQLYHGDEVVLAEAKIILLLSQYILEIRGALFPHPAGLGIILALTQVAEIPDVGKLSQPAVLINSLKIRKKQLDITIIAQTIIFILLSTRMKLHKKYRHIVMMVLV
ncbi:hypothetical protein [Chryseobacterium sp. MFBS3-17]|uniref:hypothetical protein n=1 Tax=Chryseobacterium sp. MFBS3-17 TaxID=2886689 RepID=UPI001D0EF915|nr:hypothetical protein [Chryseobacterium sp. MFBS3-17]MCC2591325.1 hypothetical protein [Chryseobacterium sp. MFBS3-17]